MPKRGKFTRSEIETAIRVLIESQMVKNWVTSEAKFLEVDLNTPAGQEFYEREARLAAERLIK